MQGIITALVIKWIVGELSAAGSGADWAGIKAKVDAQVATFMASLHLSFATPEAQSAADAVLAAVAKLAQDSSGMQAVLSALAAKDALAAEAALKVMLSNVATGDLAKIIAAV